MLTQNEIIFIKNSNALIAEAKIDTINEKFFDRCKTADESDIPRYLFLFNNKKYPVKFLKKLLIDYTGWRKIYFMFEDWKEYEKEIIEDIKFIRMVDEL